MIEMVIVNNNELPVYVQKYSDNTQSQFRHVFNTVHKSTQSEARAFKAANSVLKKRFEKSNSMVDNTRTEFFHRLMDEFLGDLDG